MDIGNITIIFSNVFKHLSPEDLPVAAQVSKKWHEYIKSEIFRRCTYLFISDKKIKNFGLHWNFKNKFLKKDFNVISSLGVFSSKDNSGGNDRRGPSCNNREFSSFMINLQSNFNMKPLKERKSFFIFTFPKEDSADVTILSFINHSIAKKTPFNVLYFVKAKVEQSAKLFSYPATLLKEEYQMSSILLIFCQHTCYKNLLKFVECFHEWYECQKMAIWIAVVDELSICRYNLGNHNSKIDSEFVFIFINNPSIVTYVHFLSNECDDPDKIRTELKSFREESELSFSSMAFMHVSYIRLKKLFDLDVLLFREIFPDVNLLPIYGTTSSYGSCFCDFKKPALWPVREDRGNQTSILIISRK